MAAEQAAAATGAGSFLPYVGLGLGAIDLVGKLFSKSDKQIRQEQIQNYIKRRIQARNDAIARLNEQTGKNVGRINAYTTGTLQRTQGDLAARSASHGRGADEADFLAAQGQITSQGSESIQKTQDASDELRRRIEDQSQEDINNADMESAFTPESPRFTDVLGSLASPVLKYGMDQQYLDKMNPSGTSTPYGRINVNSLPEFPNVSSGYDFNSPDGLNPNVPVGDRVTSVSKPSYNFMDEQQNNYPAIPRRRQLRGSYYPQGFGGN